MQLGVRYRCRCRLIPWKYHSLYINNHLRQYSLKEPLKSTQQSPAEKSEDDCDIIPQRHNGSKVSNIMNSLLHSSMDSLENFILKQAPTQNDTPTNGFNAELLDLDSDNIHYERTTAYSPLNSRLYNKHLSEYLDLNNEEDVNHLLSIERTAWFRTPPEIDQFIEKHAYCDIPCILNFYIRSLPEFQIESKDNTVKVPAKYTTNLGENAHRKILSLLINQQWFTAASFILCRRKLSFSDLVNTLNDILDTEPILQKPFMRYFFLIHFHQQYRDVNPLVLKNLDFLATTTSIQIFQMLNMMWHKRYTNDADIEEDADIFKERFADPGRVHVFDSMRLLKSITLIKEMHPFDKDVQMKKILIVLNSALEVLPLKNSGILSIIIRHIVSFDESELKYMNHQHYDQETVTKFSYSRIISLLENIVLQRKIPITNFDALTVMSLRPKHQIGRIVWEYNLAGMNNTIKQTVYYKFLIEKFVTCFEKNSKQQEVIKVEFAYLSPRRKINIISKTLLNYFKSNNMLLKSHVGGYINLTNDPKEHSHVMKRVLTSLFKTNLDRNGLNVSDLFIFLELVAINSPTLSNKEILYEAANDIIEAHQERGTESTFLTSDDSARYTLLKKFIEKIHTIDPKSSSYVAYLHVSMVRFCMNASNSEVTGTDVDVPQLSRILNRSFDLITSNPKYLRILNPKKYPSKTYIIYQGLLQRLAQELYKLPQSTLIEILKSRVKWICSKDQDWISEFNKKVFVQGVFLEVFFRRAIRPPGVSHSDMNPKNFQVVTNAEMTKLAFDEKVWACVEALCGFEWNEMMTKVLICGEQISDEDFEGGADLRQVGAGVTMVLNEIEKMSSIPYKDRIRSVGSLNRDDVKVDRFRGSIISSMRISKTDDANEIIEDDISEKFENATDSLFDDVHFDVEEAVDEKDASDITEAQYPMLIGQDLMEFNELYQNLKAFKKGKKISSVSSLLPTDTDTQLVVKPAKMSKAKKHYSFREKERLMRLYSPLRLKGLMIESLVRANPIVIDAIVRRLFVEYDDRIPISLLQHAAVGLMESGNKKANVVITFTDKVNVIKILDVITSIIYTGGSNKSQSYLFMKYVEFRRFRVALVDMIIGESIRIDGGSLKTLNWAMKKITSSPNLHEYENAFSRWNNTLNNMKEQQIGFWNPRNTGHWED